MAPRPAQRSSAGLRVALCVGAVAALSALLHSAGAFVQLSRPSSETRRQLLLGVAGGLAGAANAAEAGAGELFALPQPKKRNKKQIDFRAIQASIGKDIGLLVGLNGACFEIPDKEAGKVARSSAGTIAYDPDAPCGAGKAFIHSAGESEFAPMTAEAGPGKHKYYAAIFDGLVVDKYVSQVGKCFDIPQGGEDGISWEIANTGRGGMCDY
eukprot:gb/GFBE01013024.1/.p1 GENE.gb/GFBE01013024.1/~~gb/GFBE01013024.1/.p1  ORF type:complete len:211 (+),score=57.50 gb/GFBE01013024.1/:1-633(+)